jgi:hypothetical protein
MKEILYTPRGFTQSNNEYVTVSDSDMADLIQQSILTMSAYSELTATSEGSGLVCNRNKELYGRRGNADIAPGRANTRLSVLGGFVSNYFKKDERFKNDISMGQLPYLSNVLNEVCNDLGYEPVVFRAKLFDFGK